MLTLKKTVLAFVALGSSMSFAGMMGPVCSAVNVTTPCENTAWDIGGRALYMRTTNNFNISTYSGSAGRTNTFFDPTVNPSWGWGFQLESSYHYSSGNDFNINWYHYRAGSNTNTLNEKVINAAFPPLIPGVYQSWFPGTFYSIAPTWDQVNLEFGQHIDFGENKFVRMHAGMNYSRVGLNAQQNLLYGRSSVNNYDDQYILNANSVYNGFGPRVGMDLNYQDDSGLGVYGTGALSVLAGTSKANFSYDNYGTGSSILGGNLKSTSSPKIVGELDAKLGMIYTYSMDQGDLSLDVGWAFAQYIGALNASNLTAAHDYRGGAPTADNFDANFVSSFQIQGLYFGLKWIESVA